MEDVYTVAEDGFQAYSVKAIIYPKGSHLLGTNPPESWKKAFPAEKRWPTECNAARKDCFAQEFRFLEAWGEKMK